MAKLNFSIALGLAANNFKQGLSGVQNQLKGFASSVKSVFGMVAGAFAAGQIKAFSQECMNAYSAQLQAEQKLSVIMKQRMGVTDAEVKSVLKLASAQQELGVIGDEVQLAGAQQVATFLNDKKALDSLIPAMNNLLAQQKGLNATQGDAVNIGNLMGKVMQGQTSALKRVGISFSEAEEKVLKYGTEEQKAAMLAQVIKNNVGEMNAALAQTDAGKMQQLNNTLGDLKEKIGAAIMPIMGKLAPNIAQFAQTGSQYIVSFINTVSENFRTFAELIVSIFAAIKLTPFIQSMIAETNAAQQQILANAQATATKRQAIEQRVQTTINQLRVLEAKQAEATGAKLVQIEQQIATKRTALKQQLVARNAAVEAEMAAQSKAAAVSQVTIWSTAWNGVKAAGVMCWTTIKAAMISTGIGALIMGIIFLIQKLWDLFKDTRLAKECWDGICNGCKAAWNWGKNLLEKFGQWYDSLGTIGKAVLALVAPFTAVYGIIKKIIGALNKKWAEEDAMSEAAHNKLQALRDRYKRGQASSSTGGGGGDGSVGGGTGGGKITTTTKEKTPAEQAAEDVAKAEKDYAKAIKKAQEDTLNVADAQKNGLSAVKSLYDAYLEAYVTTGNEGYKGKMDALIPEIQSLASSVEAADEVTQALKDAEKEAEEKVRKAFEAKKQMNASLAKLDKDTAGGRDTTFDYKKTDNEKIVATLEFDLEKAKQQLEILKEAAEQGCVEAINEIEAAEATVQGLDEALKLEKVNQDIEDLKGQLSEMSFDAVQQGWGAIKSTVSDIQGLITTMEDPDATGWEKFATAIDTVMGLMNTYMQIMETVNTIQKISTALTQAKSAATAADTVKTAANTAASTANTTAKSGEAVANATAEGAKQSFPLNIVAIALGVAAVVAALATSFSKGGIAGFSKGGIKRFAGGGTVAGMSPNGDFINARLNSGEMVLTRTQQSRLFRIANGESNGNAGPINLRMRVRGRDLISCEDNEARISALSGKRVNH